METARNLARIDSSTALEYAPMSVGQVLRQVQTIQQVMASVMRDGVHYGKIPGTQSNTLFKPGAEILAATFHIAPHYVVEDLSGLDDVSYRVKCIGIHQLSGTELGQGLGSASSNEEKWKWKRASGKREFDATPVDRRRLKFGYNSKERKEFEIMQVRVEPADIANTVLKMACKRAEIAMILTVLAAGDIFAQDLEEMPEELREAAAETPKREPIQMPRERIEPGESMRERVERKQAEPAPDSSVPEQSPNSLPGPLTTGQINLLRGAMRSKNVDDAEIEKMYGAPLERLPFEQFAEIKRFILGEQAASAS